MKAKLALIMLYRIFAITLTLLPVMVNFIEQGSLISSFLYVPLISCMIAGITIFADGVLVNYLMPETSEDETSLTLVATNQTQPEQSNRPKQVCCVKVTVKDFNSAA